MDFEKVRAYIKEVIEDEFRQAKVVFDEGEKEFAGNFTNTFDSTSISEKFKVKEKDEIEKNFYYIYAPKEKSLAIYDMSSILVRFELDIDLKKEKQKKESVRNFLSLIKAPVFFMAAMLTSFLLGFRNIKDAPETKSQNAGYFENVYFEILGNLELLIGIFGITTSLILVVEIYINNSLEKNVSNKWNHAGHWISLILVLTSLCYFLFYLPFS